MRLLPARDKSKQREVLEGINPIVDLDALISEPQVFRWNGRNHAIKPITTQVFFEVTQKLARIDGMRSMKDVQENTFIEIYSDLFRSVCDTLDRDCVQKMQMGQRGALLQFILDCMRGRAQMTEPEKKKTLTA